MKSSARISVDRGTISVDCSAPSPPPFTCAVCDDEVYVDYYETGLEVKVCKACFDQAEYEEHGPSADEKELIHQEWPLIKKLRTA